ncbi:MAG TPA: hypothetical protein VI031_07460 [Pyrinomonadaceae bacterium]
MRLCAFAGNNKECSEPAGHIDQAVEHGRAASRNKALVVFIDERIDDNQGGGDQKPPVADSRAR